MATWPITREIIRRKVRMAMQDLSVSVDEQDTPDDDALTTGPGASNALGINTYIDEGIRHVCSELDVITAVFREFIPFIAGQSIYALTAATAAGAYDIQSVLISPTAGFTGDLTDQFLEYEINEITFEEMREVTGLGPAKTLGFGASSTPNVWCRYPRAANTTAEQTPRVQVWPPPGSGAVSSKTLSPIWAGPITGLATDATVLSLPAPADACIAFYVAWLLLDARGDHSDAARADNKYQRALLALTATHGSRDRLFPRRPVDYYANP